MRVPQQIDPGEARTPSTINNTVIEYVHPD